jgi:hypothetical protein
MLEKENYKLDKGLSTKEAKVFVDKNGNPLQFKLTVADITMRIVRIIKWGYFK